MFYRIIYFWTICVAVFSAHASKPLNDVAYPLHTILLSSDSYQSKLARITQALKCNVNSNEKYKGDSLLITAITPTARISSTQLNADSNIINRLIVHGANVNDEDKNGNTALIKCMHSLSKENIKNIQTLIKYHAEVNHSNHNGNHALIELLRHNNSNSDNNTTNTIEAIYMLLDHGISPNKQNKNGDTALHIAIENKQYDIAKLLVQHGASYSITNNNGLAPETVLPFKSSVNNLSYKDAFMCINEIDGVDTSKKIKNILIPFKATIKHELETYDRLTDFKRGLKNIREDVYNDWVSFMVFKRGAHDKAFENDILHLPSLIIEKIFKYTCPTLPIKKAFWKSKKRVNQELLNSKELTNDNEFRSKKLKYNHE